MSYRSPAESNIQRAVDILRDRGTPMTLTELHAIVGGGAHSLSGALQQRRDTVGDIESAARRWRYCVTPGEPEPVAKASSGSGVIAAPRVKPTFTELRGYLSNLNVRPGSLDLLRLPSRIGSKRLKP